MWYTQEEIKRMNCLRLQALEREKRVLGWAVGSPHKKLARDVIALSLLSFVCPMFG